MIHIATLLLLISLVAIIYQDFKNREVSIVSFLGIFLPLLYVAYPGDATYWVINTCVNIVIIVIQLLVSFITISVRQQKLTNIVNVAIGVGDIVMLGILALCFSTPLFILIMLVALVVSLLHFLVGRILKWERKSIPLAGIMALVLVVTLGFKYGGIVESLYEVDIFGLMMLPENV